MMQVPAIISEHDLARFEVWMHQERHLSPNHAWRTRLMVRKLITAGCRNRVDAGELFQTVTSQRRSSLRNGFGLFLEFIGTDEL